MSKHATKRAPKNPRTGRAKSPVLDAPGSVDDLDTAARVHRALAPHVEEPKPWRPRYQQSGTLPGESVGDAIRRYVAWLVLAREQLDHGGDRRQVHRDLTGCAETLATLSLEVDALEGEREAPAFAPLPAHVAAVLGVENELNDLAQDYNVVSLAAEGLHQADLASTLLRLNARLEAASAKLEEARHDALAAVAS